jgi:glycosyltransferase involved in cell wall biosynthesis
VRILHLSQRYFPAVGGAEIELEKISDYLVAAGHEVVVATSDALDFELFWDPAARRIADRRGEHHGVQIIRFPVRHLPASQLAYRAIRRLMLEISRFKPLPVGLPMHLANYTPRVPELNKWIKHQSGPFDLVAGMNITYERFLADGLRVARRLEVPFVSYPLTHLGSGERPATDRMSQYYTMRHQVRLVEASTAVVAQTPAEKRFYEEIGIPASKIIVGGPGVNPAEVEGGDGQRFVTRHGLTDPFVLAVGVMSLDKGTVHLVEAMRRLWQQGRKVELVLIGHPVPEFEVFLQQIPSRDRDRIRYLGPVDDSEKKDALAAANLFTLASRAESFGIVYLEAWLYGLAVVGARTWGVSDIIDNGQDGLLVPFADVPALAQAIETLLDHPQEAAAMGERGRQKVLREHTWELKCRLILDLYQRLVQS